MIRLAVMVDVLRITKRRKRKKKCTIASDPKFAAVIVSARYSYHARNAKNNGIIKLCTNKLELKKIPARIGYINAKQIVVMKSDWVRSASVCAFISNLCDGGKLIKFLSPNLTCFPLLGWVKGIIFGSIKILFTTAITKIAITKRSIGKIETPKSVRKRYVEPPHITIRYETYRTL